MTGFNDRRQNVRERIFAPQADHFGTRDHHVAGLQLGHGQGALDHGHGVGVEQAALGRLAQQLEQLSAFPQAPGQRARQAPAPPASRFLRFRLHHVSHTLR